MIKATARENTLPGNSLTVQMKGGIQNLKRVFQYFFRYGSLCFSFFFIIVSNQPNTGCN